MKAKTKLTKLWSVLLVLVMVVGMLPTVALAEEPATATADFSANPTAALALLNAAKTADAEDSTWDSTTKTLTLNGVNFETTAAIAVILPDDAKIVLNGDNIITSGEATSKDSFGICALGDLTINGDGKLDVTGGTATGNSHGIYATNGLSISGTATVTAKGGAAGYYSYGIGSDTTIDISGGTVYAEGGGTSSANSFGLCGIVVTISGADVTAKGGTANDEDGESYGIYAYKNVEISGGTTRVTATGGAATKDSYGIYSKRNTEISGGTVKAYGGDTSSGYSYGIYTDGSLTISDDADVTANGGKANYNSYGIYANTGLTISGDNTVVTATGGEERARKSKGIFVNSNYVTIESGKVEATGGKAGVESYGIEARDNIEISGGTVTATGGEVTSGAFTYSFGIYSNNNVTISNTATVTAKGGETTNYDSTCSHGIYASNGLSISGGTVTAQAGTAKTARAFEKSPSISISPYWWRTSAPGDYTKSTDSGYTFATGHTYVEIRDTDPATTYTVSFDANGGTGTMADVTGISGEYTLPANGFTAPEGKQFKCWSVNGTEKAARDKITVTADTTVTAVWENIPVTTYTVSFAANGGTGTMADVTGVLGDYTLPANGFTAPDGKQFKAWSVGGTEKAVGDKITVTADTTVKAVWENIPAAPTEYNILDGANSSWTHDSDGSLSIRGSGAFSEFVGVKVDGKSVDKKYYTVKEGSTIVTLKPKYLNTLTAGKHTLEIVWTDGTADTTFTVDAKPANTDTKSPQTGDSSSIVLWIALLFVSAAGVLATSVFGKKKKYQAE